MASLKKVFIVSCDCTQKTIEVFSSFKEADDRLRYLSLVGHRFDAGGTPTEESDCRYTLTERTVDDKAHPATNVCPENECMECAIRDCPRGSFSHYWGSDGCIECSR